MLRWTNCTSDREQVRCKAMQGLQVAKERLYHSSGEVRSVIDGISSSKIVWLEAMIACFLDLASVSKQCPEAQMLTLDYKVVGVDDERGRK